MVAEKGRRTSQTASRPVLKTKKPDKNEALTKEDATLQKKIAKEGLRVKASIPHGNISLKTGEQISFKKKNEAIEKKKSKKGKTLKVKKTLNPPREAPGIISLCNLPHGFFERQLNKFFSQFGEVRQVRLIRSEKTGKSCGYGYVEMGQEMVARIAARAMHNYLTYGKIIKCRYINYTKNKSEGIFGEKQFRESNCPRVINRVEAITKRNAVRSDEQTQKRAKQVLSSLNKKMLQLESLGVKLDLNVDIGDLKLKRGKKRKATEVNEKTEEVASDKPQKKRRKKKNKEPKVKSEVVTADKEKERVPSEGIIPLNEEGSVPSEEKVISGEGKEIVPSEEKIPSGEEKESVPLEEKESVSLEVKESVPLEEKVPSSEEKRSVPSNTAEDNVVFEADESDDEIVIKTPPFAKKKLVKITRSSPAVRLTDSAKFKAKLGKKTPTKKDLALESTPKSGKSKTPKKNRTPKASEVLSMQQEEIAQKNTPKKTPMKKNALAETALESTPKSGKSKTPVKNKTPKASEVLTMQQEEIAQKNTPKKTPKKKNALAETALESTPKSGKSKTPGKNKTPKASEVLSMQQEESAQKNTTKKTPMKKDALVETALEGTPKSGKSKTPGKNKTPKASEVQTKPQQASAKKNTSKKRRMSVIGGDENQEGQNQKRKSL